MWINYASWWSSSIIIFHLIIWSDVIKWVTNIVRCSFNHHSCSKRRRLPARGRHAGVFIGDKTTSRDHDMPTATNHRLAYGFLVRILWPSIIIGTLVTAAKRERRYDDWCRSKMQLQRYKLTHIRRVHHYGDLAVEFPSISALSQRRAYNFRGNSRNYPLRDALLSVSPVTRQWQSSSSLVTRCWMTETTRLGDKLSSVTPLLCQLSHPGIVRRPATQLWKAWFAIFVKRWLH